MASQFKSSPFFSPRPHLPGVGRHKPCISSNIFTEFMKLSPLSDMLADKESCAGQIQETNTLKTNIDEQIESSYPSDSNSMATRHPNPSPSREIVGSNSSNDKEKPKYPTCVIDRDRNGNENLVPYKFKKTTLRLFDLFKTLNISFEAELYKPKEERMCVDQNIFYCKNLFLKDRKGQYFLVICHEETNMELKYLRKVLKAYRNFNFVTGEEMKVLLGTDPGGVTPLALMFANALDVSMVISRTLYKEGAWLMFHTLDSSVATKMSLPSLLRFLKQMELDVIERLPADWQTFFKYLVFDENKAELIYNDMMFSQYGSQPEWSGLMKSLLVEDPYIEEKQLLFKPRLLLLPENLQDQFLKFLLSHCSRIPDAYMCQFINGLVNRYHPESSSFENITKLKGVIKTDKLLPETVEKIEDNSNGKTLTDWKVNKDCKLVQDIQVSTTDVIVIDDDDDDDDDDCEQPAKRQRLNNGRPDTTDDVLDQVVNMGTPGETSVKKDGNKDKPIGHISATSNSNGKVDQVDEMESIEEEANVSQETLALMRRLKEEWANDGTGLLPKSVLEEISTLSLKQIEFICGSLDLTAMSDESVLTVCGHLTVMYECFSYTAIVCLLKYILFGKVERLKQNASRQLIHAITQTAGTFPKQFVDAVLIPGVKDGIELSSFKADIYITVTKDSLNSGTRLYFLQQLVACSVKVTDHSICVIQCIIDSGCDFVKDVFHKLLEILQDAGSHFTKNLKFGKLLLSVTNKHGKDMANWDLLENAINVHDTFLKKTIQLAWRKLKA